MNVQSDDISSKKAAILQSALELIGENGFHGVPMSLVAKKAGVAAGTIYHYFESKDAIIRELSAQIKNEMAEAMFSPDHEDKDYRTRFFVGWINFCRYFINKKHALTFIEQFNSSPYSNQPVYQTTSLFKERFNAFFQLGMDQGFVKQVEYNLIAAIVFGCIVTTAKFHIQGHYEYTDSELTKIANIIWDGIRVPDSGI
ncbi:MAG TPA: TetR/AcrR family transcriptional regulator [Flavitalea sp.]|nr:TetR/AcrR family transcriptional regulator [Flavitalea sp.]